MLNEWSDRAPEPPPPPPHEEAENYVFRAIVGVLAVLWIAAVFAALILLFS